MPQAVGVISAVLAGSLEDEGGLSVGREDELAGLVTESPRLDGRHV